MKNNYPIVLLTLACIIICVFRASSQLPEQHWIKQYGGSAVEVPFTIKNTIDGGTIVAGYTTSKDGDVANVAGREYWDLWIIKLDACGNLQWQQTFGGSGYESARDIVEIAGSGYLVLGETNSTDGGVIAGYGATRDIWLLRLDNNGNLISQKRIGGSGLDIGNQLYALNDGNFLIAGTTSSNDGDIRANHSSGGYTDGLLAKIDGTGNVIWTKCYGGSKNEELLDIEITGEEIFVAGYANSIDGDIPANQKNYDVWLLKVDANGNILFSKIYGGSQNDVAYSMTTGANGTLTLAGYTTSNDGDVSGLKGSQDYWIINVNTSGNINWQKTLGGSDAEYANYILSDSDGGYLAGGISYSTDGDVKDAHQNGDFWLVKLSAAGEPVWTRAIGEGGNDYLRSLSYKPLEKEYYIAGDSESDEGDLDNNKGATDFTVLKFKIPDSITIDTMVCDVAGFNMAPQTITDVCGYDSLVVTYRPTALTSPFENLTKVDTIFEGQSITLPAARTGSITWSSHPTLSCSNCRNPVASPTQTVTYTARMEVNGCNTSDQFTVVVLRDALVHLPNAFTPDNDGRNDMFGPAGKVPSGYEMHIFNRNGQLVFKSSAMNTGWDGRLNGIPQPSGTFVYVVKYMDMHNQVQLKKGTLVLLR